MQSRTEKTVVVSMSMGEAVDLDEQLRKLQVQAVSHQQQHPMVERFQNELDKQISDGPEAE